MDCIWNIFRIKLKSDQDSTDQNLGIGVKPDQNWTDQNLKPDLNSTDPKHITCILVLGHLVYRVSRKERVKRNHCGALSLNKNGLSFVKPPPHLPDDKALG
jgi:hypothetical protein